MAGSCPRTTSGCLLDLTASTSSRAAASADGKRDSRPSVGDGDPAAAQVTIFNTDGPGCPRHREPVASVFDHLHGTAGIQGPKTHAVRRRTAGRSSPAPQPLPIARDPALARRSRRAIRRSMRLSLGGRAAPPGRWHYLRPEPAGRPRRKRQRCGGAQARRRFRSSATRGRSTGNARSGYAVRPGRPLPVPAARPGRVAAARVTRIRLGHPPPAAARWRRPHAGRAPGGRADHRGDAPTRRATS